MDPRWSAESGWVRWVVRFDAHIGQQRGRPRSRRPHLQGEGQYCWYVPSRLRQDWKWTGSRCRRHHVPIDHSCHRLHHRHRFAEAYLRHQCDRGWHESDWSLHQNRRFYWGFGVAGRRIYRPRSAPIRQHLDKVQSEGIEQCHVMLTSDNTTNNSTYIGASWRATCCRSLRNKGPRCKDSCDLYKRCKYLPIIRSRTVKIESIRNAIRGRRIRSSDGR